MPPFWRERPFWAVSAIVLFSRLLLLAFAQWLPGDDGLRYLQEALNLRDFGVFSSSHAIPPLPTAHDLPIFPFLLSVVLKLVPAVSAAARTVAVLNALFFTTAVAALYSLARLIGASRSVSVLAALLFASFPETLPYSLFYMPDSLFTAVFLWSIVLMVCFLRAPRLACLVCSFALLAVSVLIKPASLLFCFVFALWLAVLPFRASLPRRAVWIVCGLLVEFAVLCPWMWRNNQQFGHPVLTTITGTNLFEANYLALLQDRDPLTADQKLAAQEAKAQALAGAIWSNPVERANRLGAIATREIKSDLPGYLRIVAKRHPRLYAGTGALALLRMFGDDGDVANLETWQTHLSVRGAHDLPVPVLALQTGSWLILAFAYLAACAGMLVLFHGRAWLPLAVGLIPLLYFAAVIGPMTYTRYRLPMDPFFSLLAAYGISWVAKNLMAKSSRVPETAAEPVFTA